MAAAPTDATSATSSLGGCGRALVAAATVAAEGVKGLLVWAPILAAALCLLTLAGREAAKPAYPACEVPLVPWALTAGSAAGATAVLAFVHFLSSTCVLLCPGGGGGGGSGGSGYDPKAKGGSGGGGGERGWWRCRRVVVARVNVDPHAAPTGPALFITSATAVLAMFLIAWCYVGAVWLLPLRESPAGHHCHPALFTVSYVVVLAVAVGSILIAMLSAALACCGCIFAAAVGTAVRSFIDATLSYVGLAAPRAGSDAPAGAAGGAGGGSSASAGGYTRATPPLVVRADSGGVAGGVEEAEYPEVRPSTSAQVTANGSSQLAVPVGVVGGASSALDSESGVPLLSTAPGDPMSASPPPAPPSVGGGAVLA